MINDVYNNEKKKQQFVISLVHYWRYVTDILLMLIRGSRSEYIIAISNGGPLVNCSLQIQPY